MIVLGEIQAPNKSNCQDNLNILTVTSAFVQDSNSVTQPVQPPENNLDLILEKKLNFKDVYSIKLRAGTIEKKIRNSIPQCANDACKNIFYNNIDRIDGIFYENAFV